MIQIKCPGVRRALLSDSFNCHWNLEPRTPETERAGMGSNEGGMDIMCTRGGSEGAGGGDGGEERETGGLPLNTNHAPGKRKR